MSTPTEKPAPYRVVYSERVRARPKQLLARAAARGVGPQALSAVKEIDRLLHLYPQFGEPLKDLNTAGETEWIGTIGPLVVRYVVDEGRRIVLVLFPFPVLANLRPQ
jgi:hypothetical protein